MLQFDYRSGGALTIIDTGTSGIGGTPTIAWQGWGSPTAIGSAVAFDTGCLGVQCQQVRVSLTMSGLTPCGDVNVYSTVDVVLAPGATPPTKWDFAGVAGEHQSVGCWPGGGCPVGKSTCTVERFSYFGPWRSPVGGRGLNGPFGIDIYTSRLRLRGWGSPEAVGEGFLWTRNSLSACYERGKVCPLNPLIYPVKYVLSDPRWCDGQQYSKATAEAYGNGSPAANVFAQFPAPPSYNHLLSEIGRKGVQTEKTSGALHGCV